MQEACILSALLHVLPVITSKTLSLGSANVVFVFWIKYINKEIFSFLYEFVYIHTHTPSIMRTIV